MKSIPIGMLSDGGSDKRRPVRSLPLLCLCLVFILFASAAPAAAVIQTGDTLPDLVFQRPMDPAQATYLGVRADVPISLSLIPARFLVVEVLNVHCTSCRKLAPVSSKLFEKIHGSTVTRKAVKMIGIASGNAKSLVDMFQREFSIPFPVVPDPDFRAHEAVGLSPIPLTLIVRQQPDGTPGIVAGKHVGYFSDPDVVFQELITLLEGEHSPAPSTRAAMSEAAAANVSPSLSEIEIGRLVSTTFQECGADAGAFSMITLPDGEKVYAAPFPSSATTEILYARVVSRPPPCDVCHLVSFFYVFDDTGRILRLVPIDLSKYGNRPWSKTDIETLRSRIEGRLLTASFPFDPQVDAISAATISTAVVYHALDQGKALLEALKTAGAPR